MIKTGITGGIGSGKSIVCDIFKKFGISVYNADEEAKKLTNEDEEIKASLIKLLGPEIYITDNELNRKLLAKIIFTDKNILEKVNSIIHPVVRKHYSHWLESQKNQPYTIKEAAILFESNSYKDLDFIIMVFSPEELRIKRVMERDHTTIESVKKRIDSQMKDEEKLKLSDFVIYNDDQHLLVPQVIEIHQKLLLKV